MIAVAASLAAASVASAQYRVDNSQANDASNRIGSGGFNGGGTVRVPNAGNLVVTGNVTGGREFRGSLGYTAASEFRGNLGSGAFDRFYSDSVGVGQIRQAPTALYANPNAVVRPYFAPGQTVQRPAGFTQDATTGGFVPQTPRTVVSNDGRIDYGGATNAQVYRGLASEQTVIGGPGFTNSAGGTFDRNNLSLSEYTTMARRGDVSPFAPQRTPLREDPLRGAGATTPDGAKAGDAAASPEGLPQSTLPGATTPRAADDRDGRVTPTAAEQATAAGRTGQSLALSTKSNDATGAQQQQAARGQYATLQERYDLRRSRLPNADEAERVRLSNERVRKSRENAESQSVPGAANPRPGTLAPAGMLPGGATTGQRLSLPTQGGSSTRPAAGAAGDAGPLEIKSLASGVANPALRDALADAASLMKSGKFTSAIDAFDRAEAIDGKDPLVFAGRAIAELGGGYYRNAESHLRQAFANNRPLLMARFDVREMLGSERFDYLAGDLARNAQANAGAAGPLVLLAFLQYNDGHPAEAAASLRAAQQRANDRDELASLFQSTWSLPQADEQNK